MAQGPGKYNAELTALREQLQADGVILIVFGGVKGHGYSAQIDSRIIDHTPAWLREIADGIERDRK